MEEISSLDDGPTANFEKVTLEISNDDQGLDSDNNVKENDKKSKSFKNTVTPKNLPSIPYQHIDTHTFFSDRNEVVEKALKDCQERLITDLNEEIVGSWLLTEISLWDTEKERLVLLTKSAFYSVKYDLISLKILEYNRVPLVKLDKLIIGELVYPNTSIAPKLNGLAEGVSSIFNCAIRQQWSSFSSQCSISQFEPRGRNMTGIRLMWNGGQRLPLKKQWNPFAKNIPWLTYSSHPLFWHKGSEDDQARFDVQGLYSSLKLVLPESCNITTGAIILENYCGVGALFHNKNSLGFFKIRGKISF
ncbi:tumor protein p63-regulated gene 1 protein-like [Prorops nasuta]|uniref:tumor protein p63-regulated gene 1 protein-like n=1 Tax=Prorops nasuta TaxID=863751 RepID=UPI0034CE4844